VNLSPEEFEDAVAFSLFNQLDPEVAAQTSRYAASDAAAGRDIPLPSLPWEAFKPGGVSIVTTYPTVEVAAPDFQVANLDLAQRDGDVEFSLIVRHWHRHAVYDILHRQSARYSAAILSVLTRPGAISDCRVTAIRFAQRANPETEEHDEIVTGTVLGLTVETTMLRA
jgi:hypothetical protein